MPTPIPWARATANRASTLDAFAKYTVWFVPAPSV